MNATWATPTNERTPVPTTDLQYAALEREHHQVLLEYVELQHRLQPLCPCPTVAFGTRRDCPLHGDATFVTEVEGLRKMLQEVLYLLDSFPGRLARREHVQRLHLIHDHIDQMLTVPGIQATIVQLQSQVTA